MARQVSNLREFLRGGYKDLREPTTVTWHGKPIGVWTPIDYQPTPDNAHYTTVSAPTRAVNQSFSVSTTLPRWLRGEGDAQEG